jgi:hypothetical protein
MSPKIKRSGSDFVDHRVCVAALGKIYALDVRLAGIAALHPNIGKLARRSEPSRSRSACNGSENPPAGARSRPRERLS